MTRDNDAGRDLGINRGAVLYDRRPKENRLEPQNERGLVHVTAVYEETATGDVVVKVEDGTHTSSEWVYTPDLTRNFIPAGWSFPVGRKPTYHLTRNCGVDDEADLMTDGGRRRSAVGVTRGLPQHRYEYGKYVGRRMPRGPMGTEQDGGGPFAIGFCTLCGTNARNTTGVRGVFDCPDCMRVWHDSRVGKQPRSFDDFFSHS